MEKQSNNFFNVLKSKKFWQTIIAVFCLIVGILFCAVPTWALSAVKTISMIAFLAVGFVSTIVYCVAPSNYHSLRLLGIGVVCIAIGLLLVYVSSAFVIALALLMIVGGVQNIWSGFVSLKNTKEKNNIFEIVFGIVIAVLGIVSLVLASTKLAQSIVMIVFGVMLILKAIFDAILIFVFKTEAISFKELIKKQPNQTENNEQQNNETIQEKENENNSETSENS